MEETAHEYVVPYEASERGSMIVGELKSETATFPDMLVQFSKLNPYTRKAKIHLYPRLEQAKALFAMRPPFSFSGEVRRNGEVTETWIAQGIWTQSGSKIGGSPTFWSSPYGEIELLEITSRIVPSKEETSTPSAWFATNRCFVFQILANPDDEDFENAKKYEFDEPKPFYLQVSDGANAEVNRRMRASRSKGLKEITKNGFSVTIRNYKNVDTARGDADAMMILASLGSDERTAFWHWNSSSGASDLKRNWRFNAGRPPKLEPRHEPLLPRDTDSVRRFMEIAFPIYRNALHRPLFDSAVYALMAKDLVLETRIARLFAGIQGALQFALQQPRATLRPSMRELTDKFTDKYGDHLSDLWPLRWDANGGVALADLRNAVAHGDAFN